MMNKSDLIDGLNNLIKLDIDAVNAYDQAIGNAEDAAVKEKLGLFRADHERHIGDLSMTVRSLGGTPTDRSPDFKGWLIEGMTYLRSSTGTEGALKAMQTNENLTNRRYADAAEWDAPADVKSLLTKHYGDEKNHKTWIDGAIDSRIWDRKSRDAAGFRETRT